VCFRCTINILPASLNTSCSESVNSPEFVVFLWVARKCTLNICNNVCSIFLSGNELGQRIAPNGEILMIERNTYRPQESCVSLASGATLDS